MKRIIKVSTALILVLSILCGAGCRSTVQSESAEEVLPKLRLTVDNKHPLLIVPVYGESYDEKSGKAVMSSGETLRGRWESIPEDVRQYSVMEIHIGAIGKKNGRTEIEHFFESQLLIAQKYSIPVMMVCVTAGQVSIYTAAGKIEPEWVDKMYKKYTCLVGIMSTENYWTDYKAAARDCAKYLKISAENGGVLLWSEHIAKVIESVTSYKPFEDMMKKYSDNFLFTWKNTPANFKKCTDAATASYMCGLWLSGYCRQWGGLIDTWKWWEKGFGLPFTAAVKKDNDSRRVVSEPEAALGSEMINIWANGGCIYNFENPSYVYGVNCKRSPIFEKAVLEVFRMALKHPAPDKSEILKSTKAVFYSENKKLSKIKDFYSSLSSSDQTLPLYTSGRYGIIPAIPECVDESTVKKVFDGKVILSGKSECLKTTESKVRFFNSLYPAEYSGTAFAQKVGEVWAIYNSSFNSDVGQYALLKLKNGSTLRVKIPPYTFLFISESKSGLDIYLNNYRTSRKAIWQGGGKYNKKWDAAVMNQWLEESYIPAPDASEKF